MKDGSIDVDAISCDGSAGCVDCFPQLAINIIALAKEQIKKLFTGCSNSKIKGNSKALINTVLRGHKGYLRLSNHKVISVCCTPSFLLHL